MIEPKPRLEFWTEFLPELAFVPISNDVSGVFESYYLENAKALREAYPELLAEPEYRDLRGWAETFETIGLWSVEGADAHCRELVARLIAEASPRARLQLFHLLDLWARAHAPELATQIEDRLRPHFDLERGVERDPLDALRVLAAVCTLLGGSRMELTGLAVVVDDQVPPGTSAEVVLDRFMNRSDVNNDGGLQVESSRPSQGPLTLISIDQADPKMLCRVIADFFAQYVDGGYLSELQCTFVAEGLRPCLDRVLAQTQLHVVHHSRWLTCCGSGLYLVAAPQRWLAIQVYQYC